MRRLLLLVALTACAPARTRVTTEDRPHLGDAWYAHRAATLNITPEAARARDAALPAGPDAGPPDDALDAHTAREAAALWRDLCAACHGPDGQPPSELGLDPPPKTWGGFGVRMGFTFGGDAMRRGIYRSIAEGKGEGMPAWGGRLSREQMWALVRHIESL
ncbi:MAG: cytochrome c [Myxococcales bacterium]|nr:cytochrome c [Myxococcales bacterium]